MSTRGVRNNNPGNIRKGTKWVGLSKEQPDQSFCTFESPEYGIRAMFIILRTYQRKYGLLSIRKMISRYAPNTENDTDKYTDVVSRWTDVLPDAEFELNKHDTQTAKFIHSIIRYENGYSPYDLDTITRGLSYA